MKSKWKPYRLGAEFAPRRFTPAHHGRPHWRYPAWSTQTATDREMYAEIHDLLMPGGVFLNLEHVASATPGGGRLFEEFYADYLHRFLSESDPGASREEALEIYRNRPDREEDKLASVNTQCRWLREIGFEDVDCFFKVFEIALFGGRKRIDGEG